MMSQYDVPSFSHLGSAVSATSATNAGSEVVRAKLQALGYVTCT